MNKVKLGEAVSILDNRRIPVSSAERANRDKIYPYYGAQGIVDYIDDYLFDGEYVLVAEDGNNLKSLNEPIVTWVEGKFWVNNHAHILEDCGKADIRYVYYYLMTSDLRGLITGSAQPKLNQDNLSAFVMNLPSREEQHRVASVLSAIDDKIALNKRMMSELEETARLIYDYWFTQFDFPDENGNPYRSSGGKMTHNKTLNREIPTSWKVGNLYDIAHYTNGLACQRHRPIGDDKGLPVIKIREMHEGLNKDTERVSSDIASSHLINRGDLLFSWSASLEVMFWSGPTCGLNQHIFKVIPKGRFSNLYVFMQLIAYLEIFKKMVEARKTTMGHITSDHLNQSKVVLPDSHTLNRFSDATKPLTDMLIQTGHEKQKLESLRNWLLPMLMNGQVMASSTGCIP